MYCLSVLALSLFFSFTLGSYAPYYDLAKADQYFADFINEYERKYESELEYRKRFEIFKRNLKKINEWNANYESDTGGFVITQFTDQDGHRSCIDLSQMRNTTIKVQVDKEYILNAPDQLDYRDQNLVTPVKDQGTCGSCYIFAAIGNIEGMHAKQTPGDLLSLSEQQALDCYSEANCISGIPKQVMDDLVNPGCMREDDYQYKSVKETCQADPSKVKVKVTGSQEFNTPDVETLKGALYSNGAPIAISFFASQKLKNWRDTKVYTPAPTECTGNAANHAVLLVGYGTDAASGKSYWLFKNSWGTNQGDMGYFKFDMKNDCSFGQQGTCSANVA